MEAQREDAKRREALKDEERRTRREEEERAAKAEVPAPGAPAVVPPSVLTCSHAAATTTQADAEAKRLEEIRLQEEAEYALLKQSIVVEQSGTDVQEADQVEALLDRMATFIKVAACVETDVRREGMGVAHAVLTAPFSSRCRTSRWCRSTSSPASLASAYRCVAMHTASTARPRCLTLDPLGPCFGP